MVFGLMSAWRPASVMAAVLVALGTVCTAASCTGNRIGGLRDRTEDTVSKLRDVVFSRTVPSDGRTVSFEYKERGYAFKSLEEVNEYNNRAQHLLGPTQAVELTDTPLESPYWWSAGTQDGAKELIGLLASKFSREIEHPSAVWVARNASVLQKALAQRDLLQSYDLVAYADHRAGDPGVHAEAIHLQQMLARMLGPLLLSEAQYRDLVRQLPKQLPGDFTSRQTGSLAQNYLPARVIGPDDSWLEIPWEGEPFKHYVTFGGRSFVRVFVRAPNMRPDELRGLWQRLYSKYGSHLHLHAVAESTPPGMETMLVRTIGVLLQDGSFRDSSWPEEVTLRIFEYPRSQLDNQTSDFRGTLLYRYVLSRSALLAQPQSLGLQRKGDDDTQFFGFLGEVPDRHRALSNWTTTLRYNCITCHEGLFYGLATVFSFERNPQPATQPPAHTDDEGSWTNGPPPGHFKSILTWLDQAPQ